MTWRSVAVVFALGLMAVSCSGGSDESSPDSNGPSLVGVWTGTEVDGDTQEWTFVFDANNASVTSADAEVYEGSYVAYPDDDPKRLEFVVTESIFSPYVGQTAHSIFRFDGTTLIIASNEPGVGDTPDGFAPGGGTRVWELTQQ